MSDTGATIAAIEALEPCPFCGRHLVKTGRPESWAYEHIAPEGEGCLLDQMIVLQDDDDITAWNTRASARDTARLEAEVARLRKIMGGLLLGIAGSHAAAFEALVDNRHNEQEG